MTGQQMPEQFPAPPYPADTRAKGWRFELDYEQIDQSDTWDLAPPEARPWLLMMWYAAWKQTPCGSLPADEEILPAKFGMPAELWAKYRRVMLRGWWQASDGRLYHDTLVARVIEMLDRRRKEADRKAAGRAKRALDDRKSPPKVPQMSHGTTNGQAQDSTPNPTPVPEPYTDEALIPPSAPPPAPASAPTRVHEAPPAPPEARGQSPTVYGEMARRLREGGIGRVNPGHQGFRTLVDAGVTAEEFMGYADKARSAEDPFSYLVTTVVNERKRAKFQAAQLHQGVMPRMPQTAPVRETFRERDDRLARERMAEWAPTIAADPRPAPPPAHHTDTIDMELPHGHLIEHR